MSDSYSASSGAGSRPTGQAATRLDGSRFDPSRVRIMEWAADHGQIRLTYPDHLTNDDLNELEQLFALTIRIGRRRASAIEARQGGDGEAGSVHESAAPKADAQPSSEPTP